MRSISMLMTKAILVGVLLLSPFLGRSSDVSASSAVVSGKVGDFTASALKSQDSTPLPSMAVSAPVTQTIFGAEMDQLTVGRGLNQLVAANATWTRRNAVMWLDVEPTEGTYNWSVLAGLDSELQNASSQGLQVVLIVRGTPSWAQKVAGHSCGPILATKLAAFGNFMHALVARYSVAPYNVKYWELWNEEDVDPSLVPADSVYGCWGDGWDPYYGGGYYAEMLKAVYPQVKSADSQAQVLVGGLLLFCDPAPGSGCEAVNNNKRPSKFLEGILLNNGGPYFDGVSFHAYDYYDHELGKYSDPYWKTAWNTTGPVLNAKVQFLRSVLSQYGVSGKFLMNTEVGLLCDTCSNDPVFEATKANYLAQAYSAAIVQGLRANMWYSLLGWVNSGLLDSSLNPLPAYTAFQFSRNELQDAVGVRNITEYAGVNGYEVQLGNRPIWVLWSLDGASHLVNLPYTPLAAWDALGNPVTPAASMNIDLNPIYLEWSSVTFTDVPMGYWAFQFIERLNSAGITSGCSISPMMYCPEINVTRSQMAVFLLRGEHGSTYVPPAVGTGTGFTDVPDTYWAAAWIKQLALEGITSGCGPSLFCPETPVTRDQMAVFLLRAEHGASYSPPPATGVFTDVPVGYWADRFVEQLALEGITSGCGVDTYCPTTPVNRAQMAVFLVKTFNLP